MVEYRSLISTVVNCYSSLSRSRYNTTATDSCASRDVICLCDVTCSCFCMQVESSEKEVEEQERVSSDFFFYFHFSLLKN